MKKPMNVVLALALACAAVAVVATRIIYQPPAAPCVESMKMETVSPTEVIARPIVCPK